MSPLEREGCVPIVVELAGRAEGLRRVAGIAAAPVLPARELVPMRILMAVGARRLGFESQLRESRATRDQGGALGAHCRLLHVRVAGDAGRRTVSPFEGQSKILVRGDAGRRWPEGLRVVARQAPPVLGPRTAAGKSAPVGIHVAGSALAFGHLEQEVRLSQCRSWQRRQGLPIGSMAGTAVYFCMPAIEAELELRMGEPVESAGPPTRHAVTVGTLTPVASGRKLSAVVVRMAIDTLHEGGTNHDLRVAPFRYGGRAGVFPVAGGAVHRLVLALRADTWWCRCWVHREGGGGEAGDRVALVTVHHPARERRRAVVGVLVAGAAGLERAAS